MHEKLSVIFFRHPVIPSTSNCRRDAVFLGRNRPSICSSVGNKSILPWAEQLSRSNTTRGDRNMALTTTPTKSLNKVNCFFQLAFEI